MVEAFDGRRYWTYKETTPYETRATNPERVHGEVESDAAVPTRPSAATSIASSSGWDSP